MGALAEVHHRTNVVEPTVTENKDSDGRLKTVFSFRLKRSSNFPKSRWYAKMGYGMLGRKQRLEHNRLHRFFPKTFEEDPLLTTYQDDNEKAAVTAMKQAVQDPEFTGICFLYGTLLRCRMDKPTSWESSWVIAENVALVYHGKSKNFMIMSLKGILKLDSISDCNIIRKLYPDNPDVKYSFMSEDWWTELDVTSEDLDNIFVGGSEDEVRRRLPTQPAYDYVTTSPAAIIFMTLVLGMLFFLLSRRWQERLRQTEKPGASETDGAEPAGDMV